VTDVFNDRIEKFDSTGTFITKWDWSLIGTPGSMAVDAQGNLLVTDTSNHRIVKLDTNGSVLTTFGSSGNGPGQFMAPEKIGVATSGYIYVSDSQLHFVSMFAPAGVDAGPPATGRFAVYVSVPEPITSQGDIRFSLPHAALVTVAVYDVAGHLVRGLCRDRFESTGDHEIAWDREDDHGRRVAAGVYQVLIRAESFSGTKKVVVIG